MSISISGFKALEGEHVARHYSSQHQSRLYVFDTGGCHRRILCGKKESTQAKNTLQAGKSSFNSNIRKQSQCDVLQETIQNIYINGDLMQTWSRLHNKAKSDKGIVGLQRNCLFSLTSQFVCTRPDCIG